MVFAFAALLAACQGTQLGAPVPTISDAVGVGTRSSFAVALPAGLIGLNAEGKVLGHIARLPPGATPSGPTLIPDGSSIVFALSQTTSDTGFGSDIYSVRLDGGDLRPLIKHDAPNVFYASPAFDRSGNFLYVHRRAAVDDPRYVAAGTTRIDDTIERVDLRTGERHTLVRDAAEPTVSPDGKTLVFIRIYGGDQDGLLWSAGPDGADVQPFFKTRDRFSFLQAPRISPNGREVVFTSAGRLLQNRAHTEVSRAAGGGSKLAHLDIPSELFLSPLEGTSLRLIARTGDDVVPAWSPDGTRVAYIAQGTFYVVASADGAVKVSQRLAFLYGDPVWLR